MGERKKCEVRERKEDFSARCVMDFSWDMKTNKLFPIQRKVRDNIQAHFRHSTKCILTLSNISSNINKS